MMMLLIKVVICIFAFFGFFFVLSLLRAAKKGYIRMYGEAIGKIFGWM